MKTIVPLSAVAILGLGLGVAACTPPHDAYGHWGRQARLMKSVSKLDCPSERGEFRLANAAADGRSCLYNGDDGDTLELKIVNVSGGDANAALAPIEASLHTLVPAQAAAPQPPEAPASAASASTPAKAADGAAPTNVSMHPAGGKLPAGRSGDDVSIDLPGLHVHADDDRAKVRVAGFDVGADGAGDNVKVRRQGHGGPVIAVDAHNGYSTVRIDNSDANIRTRVQVGSDNAGPEGDHSVGFIAHGPRSGPLVVAFVRVKRGGDSSHDSLYDSAIALVKHNTGS